MMPTKKSPSKRASRARAARWHGSTSSCMTQASDCCMPANVLLLATKTRRIRTSNRGRRREAKRFAAIIHAVNYRPFGKLGWPVADIGYGMWGMGGWTGSDDEESLASLDRAV